MTGELWPDAEYTRSNQFSIHPLAKIFPDMQVEEYEALKESISQHGQREPIVLFEGQVIDGQHRLKACIDLNIEPAVTELEAVNDPVAFVVDANLIRRHLETGQRAMIAEQLASWLPAGQQQSTPQRSREGNGLSAKQASDLMKVSTRSLARAREVKRNAPDAVVDAVRTGAVKLRDAANIADKPAEWQKKALESVKAGDHKRLTSAVSEMEREQAVQAAVEAAKNAEQANPKWLYVDDTEKAPIEAMMRGLEGNANVIGSADAIALLRALPELSVDLLLTDIPYARVNKPSGGLRIIDKQNANTETFGLEEFAAEVFRVTKGNAVIFCGKEQFSSLYQYFDDQGCTTRMIVWEKTNPSPMNASVMFLSGVECAVYFRKENAPFNDSYQNTVFRFPSGSSLRHPTEKPLTMFRRFIELLSNPDDLVCDPCMGSGTTAVASLQVGRRFLCSDLDPESTKVANLRLTQNN